MSRTYRDRYRFTGDADCLIHYGVPHQKWGERRYQNYNGTLTEEGKRHYGYYDKGNGEKDMKRLQKDAANDAREYARAKAYYGQGAGIRRKMIKNLISERMKDDDYKQEFERLLAGQDMSQHQKAANRERKVQDTKNAIGKTARGVKNLMLGVGSASLTAIAIYNVAKMTGAGNKIAQYGKQSLSSVFNAVKGIAQKIRPVARSASRYVTQNGRINWGG